LNYQKNLIDSNEVEVDIFMIKFLLPLFIAICVSIVDVAQESSTTTQYYNKTDLKHEKKKTELIFVGTVTAIDTTAPTIEVKNKYDKTKIFGITSDTMIIKSGNSIVLSDIKKGDRVHITYKKDGDKIIATQIYIRAKSVQKKTSKK